MKTIDFKALIESLSEEAYAIAKNELSLFFEFYYCAPESISREMLLEKLCEYINRVGQSEKSTDDALARDYVDELFPLIDSRVEKGSQAEKYFERAKSIQKRLKDNSEDLPEAMLEDFSLHGFLQNEKVKEETRRHLFPYCRCRFPRCN